MRRIDKRGVDVEYRILGPVEVIVDGRPLDLGPRKQRSLFALLLIHANRTVSTDRILEALWGEDARGKENALWVYISRLRTVLGEVTSDDVLVTKDHGYSLLIDPDAIDATAFEVLTATGLAALDVDPTEAAQTLRNGLAMWRGGALEDVAYEEFARGEIARLSALRLACVDARIEAELRCGRSGELIGELEQQLEDRPYDETPVRQLMLALYRSGRQTDALRVFERYRRRLGEDTGTDPSPELSRLEEQILFHDDKLVRGTADANPPPLQVNPYRGLRAFREEDTHLFFGRDSLIASLITAVGKEPIVTVIGPSGSGKSSVVRSGLIPALRKEALPGSANWLIASMFPGSHPFIELEAALLRSRLDTPDSLRGHLDGAPDEILRAALRVAPSEDATVLIVVDQLEELFTLCDDVTAQRFLNAVVAAAGDPRHRIRFVMTLRADFYARTLSHAGYGSRMSGGIVNIVPMAPEELELAASGPARAAGVRLEPALEAALIGDVLGEPGALPIFEFALTDLFDRRVGDTLTLDAYRMMGGIDGAVSRKAEQLFDRLTASQQEACKQVFLRLVSITDGETRSRRRVDAAELLGLKLDVGDLQEVLVAFGDERLLSFDRSERTGSPIVEVAHEALLDRWGRLSEWITLAKEDVRQNARLTALASEWCEHDRDPTYLLSQGRVTDYASWARSSTMSVGDPEREYLEASEQAHDREEREEAERVAREHAVSRRAKRNAWSLVAVVAIVAIVGSVITWVSLQPKGPTVAFVHFGGEGSNIGDLMQSGFDAAARDLDIELVDYLVLTDPTEVMRTAIGGGTDLIVGPIDVFMATDPSIAAEHPTVDFMIIDGEFPIDEPNVTVVSIDGTGGAYLMGIAAASASETGKVGLVAGWQAALAQTWAAAFEAGVRSVDPNAEVSIGWVEPTGGMQFLNRTNAYAVAADMYEEGVDVLFNVAGDAGEGIVSAAVDHHDATGRQVWVIGVDADQGLLSGDTSRPLILTSMIKRFDIAVEESIRAWLTGEGGPVTTFDLSNGGIEYSTDNPALGATVPLLEQARTDLVSGRVGLPSSTTAPSHWLSAVDHMVDITVAPTGCRFSSTPAIEAGQVIGFTIENSTSAPAWIATVYVPHDVDRAILEEASAVQPDIFALMQDVDGEVWTYWEVPAAGIYELRIAVPDSTHGIAAACAAATAAEPDGTIGSFSEVMVARQ